MADYLPQHIEFEHPRSSFAHKYFLSSSVDIYNYSPGDDITLAIREKNTNVQVWWVIERSDARRLAIALLTKSLTE